MFTYLKNTVFIKNAKELFDILDDLKIDHDLKDFELIFEADAKNTSTSYVDICDNYNKYVLFTIK